MLPVINSQIISSSQFDGRPLCPGQVVNLTCVTRGSPTIAWSSDQYIDEGGNSLEFGPRNSVGNTLNSPINPNTTVTFIDRSVIDGVEVLESQLRIIITPEFPSASVSCVVLNGSEDIVRFQVLGMYIFYAIIGIDAYAYT